MVRIGVDGILEPKSFWEKVKKNLRFFFSTWKNMHFSAWSTNMQGFNSFSTDIKMLLDLQNNDRFVGRAKLYRVAS